MAVRNFNSRRGICSNICLLCHGHLSKAERERKCLGLKLSSQSVHRVLLELTIMMYVNFKRAEMFALALIDYNIFARRIPL